MRKAGQTTGDFEILIVNTYAEMIALQTPSSIRIVQVVSDEQNNSGNPSEYTMWSNGRIFWNASIDINNI